MVGVVEGMVLFCDVHEKVESGIQRRKDIPNSLRITTSLTVEDGSNLRSPSEILTVIVVTTVCENVNLRRRL